MTQPAASAFLACWLAPFETLFTRATWQNLLVRILAMVRGRQHGQHHRGLPRFCGRYWHGVRHSDDAACR